MNYYDTWIQRSEDNSNQTLYAAYINTYYDKEKSAYAKILDLYPDQQSIIGTNALDLAGFLGYGTDEMDLFLGFLDGINPSLDEQLDLSGIADESPVSLKIDYEKLYVNMRDAKADWLYCLSAWKNVYTQDERDRLSVRHWESKLVRTEKVGRNDPCPCGSGKKYKQCCMNK